MEQPTRPDATRPTTEPGRPPVRTLEEDLAPYLTQERARQARAALDRIRSLGVRW